jgi:hypothetical protein
MFQRSTAILLMALTIFSSYSLAQTIPHDLGLVATSSVATAEPYAPLSNANFSTSATEASVSEANHATRAVYSVKAPSNSDKLQVHPFSRIAFSFKTDTLGPGVELATPLSRRINLRATARVFNFHYPFAIDGIDYGAEFHFHSGQVAADWFPFHGDFHISPGVLYFQNGMTATVSVPAGKPFSLGDTSYINSVDDPFHGSGTINYGRQMAPTLTIGMGNLISRTGRHFSVPFEVGVAYIGAAQMDVKIAGTACTYQGCFNAATDSGTQSSLKQEVQDINTELAKFKIYPILSLGFGYRF